MNVRDELLTRARNLERYPFVSATMAEAGRLAAAELRKIAKELKASEKSA
jgi:hypothetical protein